MSNIIKYWGAKDGESGKIINSNPKADAYLSELLRKRELEILKKQMASQEGDSDLEFHEIDFTKSPKAVDFARKEKESKEKAEEILREAEETSRTLIQQAIDRAKSKENEIFFAAREQGYQEGYELAIEEVKKKEQELLSEKDALRKQYDEEVEALLPKFTDLIIKYTERLTGILADDYESVIYNILASAIMNAEPSKRYLIYVPKEQYKYVLSKEDYIREVVGDHSVFEIISDSTLSVNSCKIETESYVIDTGLDTRLMTLTNSLKLLVDSN